MVNFPERASRRGKLLAHRAGAAGRVPDRRRRLLHRLPPRRRRARNSVVHARLGHRQPRPAQPRHRGAAADAAAVPERRPRAPARPARVRARLGLLGACSRSSASPCPPTASPGTPTRACPSGSTTRTRSAASHHQKIVVVDDAIAFTGGLDLTIRRWDTPAHRADDPGRVDPAGRPYPPAHDVQVMVDGDAAAALGELARARWRAATGRAAGGRPVRRREPARARSLARRDGSPTCATRRSASPARCRRFATRPPCRRCWRARSTAIAAARTLHLHREPVPDLGRDRRRARAPPGRAGRPGDRRRAPTRGARLAGAELDGRHARAPAAAPARQPIVTAACGCFYPDHPRPRRWRA